MSPRKANNIILSKGSPADLASAPSSANFGEILSKPDTVEIEIGSSDRDQSENLISVLDASGQSTHAIIGTNTVQGWVSSPALWDTVVNFGVGDIVTVWCPNFHLIFSDNQTEIEYTGPTLRATAFDSLRISVTFANQSVVALNEDIRVQSFDANPTESSPDVHFQGMSETDTHYIAVTKTARRVVVPSGTTLTPRVLLGALLKMPTMDIENTVEDLIAELNNRYGNSDDEPEVSEASLS